MNIIELSNDFCQNHLTCIRRASNILHITYTQAMCLQAIPFRGISQAELAKKLNIDISTLSRNLDKLISKQILFKEESIQDKRTHVVKLTELGENLYDDVSWKLNESVNEINNFLDYDQIEPLINSITLINWYFSKKNQSNE